MAPLGKKIILSFLLLLGFLSIVRTFTQLWNNYLPDFSIFYFATQNLILGGNPYITENLFTQLNYPPISLLLFAPLTIFPFQLASNMWLILSIIFYLVSFFSLHFVTKTSILKTSVIFFLFSISFPFKFTLGMGQVNLLLLFLLSSFLFSYKSKKIITSSFLLALSVITKLYPVLFFIQLALHKKWKHIIYSISILFLLFGLSFLVVEIDMYFYYLYEILIPISKENQTGEYYNQAVTAAFSRFGIGDLSVYARLFILGTTIYFMRISKDFYLNFSLFLLTILLINAFTWQHQLILIVISVYILIKEKSIIKLILLFAGVALIVSNIKDPSSSDNILDATINSHATIGMLILWMLHIIKIRNENEKS